MESKLSKGINVEFVAKGYNVENNCCFFTVTETVSSVDVNYFVDGNTGVLFQILSDDDKKSRPVGLREFMSYYESYQAVLIKSYHTAVSKITKLNIDA